MDLYCPDCKTCYRLWLVYSNTPDALPGVCPYCGWGRVVQQKTVPAAALDFDSALWVMWAAVAVAVVLILALIWCGCG